VIPTKDTVRTESKTHEQGIDAAHTASGIARDLFGAQGWDIADALGSDSGALVAEDNPVDSDTCEVSDVVDGRRFDFWDRADLIDVATDAVTWFWAHSDRGADRVGRGEGFTFAHVIDEVAQVASAPQGALAPLLDSVLRAKICSEQGRLPTVLLVAVQEATCAGVRHARRNSCSGGRAQARRGVAVPGRLSRQLSTVTSAYMPSAACGGPPSISGGRGSCPACMTSSGSAPVGTRHSRA
jgi:hypothetical protein